MDRRTFIGTLTGGLLAARVAARAQPRTKVATVALLSLGTDPARPADWQPFRDAMRELGYVEGQNLVVRHAFGSGDSSRLSGLVAELVRAKVDVIVATGTRETRAAMQVTTSIPIVMTFVVDPVSQGFVRSLAKPGGNVTGLTNLVPGLSQKYVELLKEVLPSASRFAVVANPPNPIPENRLELEAACRALGIAVSFLPVAGLADLEPTLIRAKREGAAGVIATADPVTYLYRHALVRLALKHRLPGIYWNRDYADGGGLMTYGASLAGLRRHAATYVDKLLKGARPADLPIEQPKAFELVINLKTAKALGLTIPPSLLQRANQVIES